MQYYVVDVFSKTELKGNPVAVVLPEYSLSSEKMLKISNWFNLSETTFVDKFETKIPSYDVRIFSPHGEFPFAGHPTLGTALAVKHHFEVIGDRLIQNCGAGEIQIRFNSSEYTVHLTSPSVSILEVNQSDLDEVMDCFNYQSDFITAAIVTAGPSWLTVIIDEPEFIVNVKPDFESLIKISKKLKITGVQLAASKGRGFEWKIRTFAPVVGVSEDPICGSGNIALAKLLSSRGIAQNTFVSRQGQEVGRDGEILIRYLEGDEIELGGAAKIIASGRLDL